jgi:spermidine synthase
VRVVEDDDGRGGASLLIDGVPSSHVDPDDPLRLDFEYMRWIGDVFDCVPGPGALAAAHLGGAACTLPRYLAATRPGSRQIVFEVDGEVLQAVKDRFGLRSRPGLRLRLGDGRQGLGTLPEHSQDLVVRDAFAGAEVPAHLATRQFLCDVTRVLRPGGLYVANLADRPPLGLARSEAATALAVFAHAALIAEPAQFKGRRYGNLVLVAADDPLPDAALLRRLASGAVRARLMTTDQVRGFAAGARVREDPDPSPDVCA